MFVRKESIIDTGRFSCWKRLVRVTAYVKRFIKNIRSVKNERTYTTLTPDELRVAETYWMLQVQNGLYERIESGEFKVLNVYMLDGIYRVGGRVKMNVTYGEEQPVLLPDNHHVSLLLVRYTHEVGHYGIATTVAKLRRKYWILKAHKLAKTVKFRCVVCRKLAHQLETQFMSDLPKERVLPYTPPYLHTAVDYFGPYQAKVSRNKTTKNYGVLFTCLNTRAVHLDLAMDVSTMEFLQVLRRFFAIRGYPASLTSDNGTQMVGAERELKEMLRGWSQEKLKEFCANKGIIWKFTTPSAPHQNGCAEALVKSCKVALKRTIGNQVLTTFELYTFCLEAANLINDRPIGRIPNDPDDGNYLSPNDILLGRASTHIPQGPFRETKNPRHRFEFVQKLVDSFWVKWSRDVLPTLVPRRKWNVHRRNVQVDDVVILEDVNTVRGCWRIGRVTEVYKGPDDRVRNIQVKTVSGVYKRPITKIAVLYPVEGYDC